MFTVTVQDGGEAWERFVTDLGASPLVSGRWVAAVGAPERIPIHLRLDDPAGTSGAIAGLLRRPSAPVLRRYGRTLFFYTGPALSVVDGEASTRAIQAIVDFARQSGMSGVAFRSWDHPHTHQVPETLAYRTTRDEYVLDLRGEMAAVDARMRPQVHRQVRQARHAGLTCQEAEAADAVDDLLPLLEETRTVRLAKGYDRYDSFYMPYLSRDALVQLGRSGLARAFRVRASSETVSVVLILVLGSRAVALLVGTNAEGYRLKAPSLLWYEVARLLHTSGVRSLNLLGVPPGPSGTSLAFFKASLGCEKVTCTHGATRLLRRSPMYLLAKLLSKS